MTSVEHHERRAGRERVAIEIHHLAKVTDLGERGVEVLIRRRRRVAEHGVIEPNVVERDVVERDVVERDVVERGSRIAEAFSVRARHAVCLRGSHAARLRRHHIDDRHYGV